MNSNEKLKYQPEVDGLRAVAIIPVLLFHFGFSAFSGGFVGVDVFFVISGYLITRLILNEVESGDFKFSVFYERRARRLFPALFVTVSVTLLLSTFYLPRTALDDAIASSVYALTSLSNVIFWLQSGYFDSSSFTKPLLHTWSLSVEEQFYLVWPSLLVLLSVVGFSRTRLLGAILALGVASAWWSVQVTNSDPSTAFFLLPFRVVEFCIGAATVWVARLQISNWIREVLTLGGLAMIALSVFTFTERTVFPGLAVLLPAFGTMAAIVGGSSSYSGRLLNNPVCIGIGLISYSLYLVHWPIAAFFDAYTLREPEMMEKLLMFGGSVVLATMMYFVVERPFRRRPDKDVRLSRAGFGLVCAILVVAVAVTSTFLIKSPLRNELQIVGSVLGQVQKFWVTPAGAQELRMISAAQIEAIPHGRQTIMREWGCGKESLPCGKMSDSQPNVLVIGDSLSVDALNTFAPFYPEANFVLLRASACAPWESVAANGQDCSEVNATRNATISELGVFDFVVVAVAITERRMEPMAEYLGALRESGVRIVVLGMGNVYTRPARDVYQRLASPENPFPSLADFHPKSNYQYDRDIRRATLLAGGTFIERRALFCPSLPCNDYLPEVPALIVGDEVHQTWEASQALGKYVRFTRPELFTLN